MRARLLGTIGKHEIAFGCSLATAKVGSQKVRHLERSDFYLFEVLRAFVLSRSCNLGNDRGLVYRGPRSALPRRGERILMHAVALAELAWP